LWYPTSRETLARDAPDFLHADPPDGYVCGFH
jgi:hypothetical protein